jgi:gliding motility-associated-like protein
MKTFYTIIALQFLVIYTTVGQGLINVSPNQTANILAQKLAGPGVTVANATFNNCDTNANGIFNVVTSNIGIDSGIILTSGDASGAFGASTVYTGVNSNFPEPDLDLLTTQAIRDACVLEFDFIPTGDTIKFNYIFGSAEYQSFTCSGFEDIFGFFVSGPGISGIFSNGAINIAYIPGTTCPITINSINSSTANPCGSTVAPCAPPNNALFVDNLPIGNTLTGMAYNGYTLPIQAITNVIPCQTYHMKLAVADASDQVLDTGVLIEAGSLSSNTISVATVTGLSAVYPYIVEGCDTAIVSVKRKIYTGSAFADTVDIGSYGSTLPGIDYNPFPNQIYFTANMADTQQNFTLWAIQDGITEGPETIYLVVQGGCNNSSVDTIVLEVRDSLYITLDNTNIALCLGDSVTIIGQADANIDITWTPSSGVANPNLFYTSIKPTSFGVQTYSVTGQYLTCPTVTRNFTITTDPIPIMKPMANREVCEGDTIMLQVEINPIFNYNLNWSTSNYLTHIDDYNKIFTGTASQNYTVTAVSPNAGCSTSGSVNVIVWPFVTGNISEDTLVCDGVPVQLFVSGGIGQYLWYPSATLSCSNCPNPVATSFGTTDYFAVLLEPHGCQDTLEVTVENHPPFNLQLLNNDTSIYYGDAVTLVAIGAPFYQWSPTAFLSSQINGTTVSTPTEDITYVVTGTSIYHGCPQTDTVRIKMIHQDIFVPNVFSPNGDGNNDYFKPWAGKQVKTLEFRIFNRWGQEVYSSNSIYTGWDGKFKGANAEAGTYFYTLRITYPSGFTNHYKGSLELIR